ncbi:MAG TPA: DUF4389 domain-containing protein [Solirubrobacterales bacterium]|nr:DUF4389 domain-containing protein [Solirubrobacterales bacterium]
MPGEYPVHVEVDRQDEYVRLLPLVKWLLAIPHFLVLIFILLAAAIAHVIAFFAVIITRRYPEGLYGFVVGAFRWMFRVQAYVLLLTDRYPPFSLQPDPDFPARYEFDRPAEIDRWRPLVQWLLAIPYLIITHALGYLFGAVTLIALFAILFTKRYPPGLFAMARGVLRWQARAVAYAGFFVDRYPPFEFDQD